MASLRSRTALVTVCSVLLLLAALFASHRLIVARAYEELEAQRAAADVTGAERVLSRDQMALSTLLVDWSSWDDTYEYIQTRNPVYESSNLPPNILQQIEVRFFVLRNASGENVFARAEDTDGRVITLPGITDRIPAGSPLLGTGGADLTGVINTPAGPMFFATRPVLRSDGSGASRGTAIMGRALGEHLAAEIGETLDLDAAITPVTAANDQESTDALRRATASDDLVTNTVGNRIVAFALIRDMQQRPLALIRLERPRDIVEQGGRTLRQLLTAGALAGLLLVVVLVALIDSTVVRRLRRLREDLALVGASGGHGALRVGVHGHDEVSSLADGVNEMLDALEAAQRDRALLIQSVTDHQRLAEAAFREMDEGVLVFDEQRRCTAVNPAALRLLGVTEADAVGRPLEQLLPTPTAPLPNHAGPLLYEIGERVVAATGPGDGDGLTVVVLRDVTDVLDIERLKSDLVTTVSHELRTPLTAVRASVDMLHNGDAGELTDVQRRIVVLMRSNVDRLRMIMDDLLDMGALEGGRVTLTLDDTDLRDLALRVVEDLRESATASGITLHIGRIEPVVAAADAMRMRHVIENLVQNAVKFTPRGGGITVAVFRQDNHAIIEVRDTGIGIPPEELESVFQKFYRTERATQFARGTGLGLSIAQSIVELHGGSIRAQSDGHTGTTMTVTLPLRPASDGSAATAGAKR